MGADQQPQLAGGAAARAARAARAPASSRSAGRPAGPAASPPRRRTARRPTRRSIVAKCCSASVSVGRHQRGLHPRLRRAQHRVERDHGLAGSDLAHQQALHRPARARGPRRSRRSASRCPSVSSNGSESSHAPHERAGRAEQLGLARLAARAPAHHERELEQEQLLEREPPPRDRHLVERLGQMRGRERVGAPGSALAGAQPRRAAARPRARSRPRRRQRELADPPGREPLGGRIDRHQARRVAPGAVVARRARARAPSTLNVGPPRPPSSLPRSSTARPRRELVGQVGLVEPHRLQRAGVVGDLAFEDLEPPAPRWAARGSPLTVTATVASSPIASSATGRASLVVAVVERQVLEQVADASRCRAWPRALRLRARPPRARSAGGRAGWAAAASAAARRPARLARLGAPLAESRAAARVALALMHVRLRR